MTTLNFLLSHAAARTLEPGDEVIVTQLDHDANVSPWFRAAEDRGLTVRVAPIDPSDGSLDLDALEALIGERTRVVAYTLASNALGNIPDSARIAAAAHRVGALAWADGVHMRLTGASIATRSAPTSCSARRTSSSARTWAWPRSAATWPRACPPTASAPPTRTHQDIGSRPAP